MPKKEQDEIEVVVPVALNGILSFVVSASKWNSLSKEARKTAINDHISSIERYLDRVGGLLGHQPTLPDIFIDTLDANHELAEVGDGTHHLSDVQKN